MSVHLSGAARGELAVLLPPRQALNRSGAAIQPDPMAKASLVLTGQGMRMGCPDRRHFDSAGRPVSETSSRLKSRRKGRTSSHCRGSPHSSTPRTVPRGGARHSTVWCSGAEGGTARRCGAARTHHHSDDEFQLVHALACGRGVSQGRSDARVRGCSKGRLYIHGKGLAVTIQSHDAIALRRACGGGKAEDPHLLRRERMEERAEPLASHQAGIRRAHGRCPSRATEGIVLPAVAGE